MEDKNEFGSPASVSAYIEHEMSKKHMWFTFAIAGAAQVLWHGYSLGTNGVRAISIIGVVAAVAALGLSVINYGTAKERILFGKIILRGGIVIKTNDEGNLVVETKVENIVDRKED